MKRSDQVRMTYCKLVRLLDDSDTSYVSIRRDAAQEMAKLADFATEALESLDRGMVYVMAEIANKYFPPADTARKPDPVEETLRRFRDEDASNCIEPPAFVEVPL